MAYTTFLLDLDHTLFDTETSETAAFAHTLATAGIANTERHWPVYQKINLALWAAVEREELQPEAIRTLRFEQFVAAQRLDADPLQMADDFVVGLGEFGDLYPGARVVIGQLSEHASLGMVTNGLSEVQRTRIDRLGLNEYFDAIAISAEVGASKPGREIFDAVFTSLRGPEKGSAVMVGDNLSADIRGGINYGIATCWYNPHERTTTHAADHEIRDLQELLALVVT